MEISDYTNIVSAIGVIITLIYLAKQIKDTNRIHTENHEWNRRIETRRALDLYNTLESVKDLEDEFKFSNANHPIEVNKINKTIKDNPLIKLAIIRLLNYYESLAIGISMGIYSEVIIKETRRGHMIKTYRAFSDYIDFHRGNGNERSFIQYEKLIKKWKEEESKSVSLDQLG